MDTDALELEDHFSDQVSFDLKIVYVMIHNIASDMTICCYFDVEKEE